MAFEAMVSVFDRRSNIACAAYKLLLSWLPSQAVNLMNRPQGSRLLSTGSSCVLQHSTIFSTRCDMADLLVTPTYENCTSTASAQNDAAAFTFTFTSVLSC